MANRVGAQDQQGQEISFHMDKFFQALGFQRYPPGRFERPGG
jgi:hypothetical protein